MKKPKQVKPFFFKDLSHQDMIKIVNTELPISLKYNEDLINRVHSRYPYLEKTTIAFIVKNIFQSLRELLILGKVLNFNKLFFDTKFYFFPHRRNGHILPSLKVKISTPPPLRKL